MKLFWWILCIFLHCLTAYSVLDNVLIEEYLKQDSFGNFVLDNFPMESTYSDIQIDFLQKTNLWETFLESSFLSLRDIKTKTIIIQSDNEKFPIDSNWKIAVMVLGTDNVWHLVIWNISNVRLGRGLKLATFSFNGTFDVLYIRKAMFAEKFNDSRLLPLDNYTIFKACILKDNVQFSKFAYSFFAVKLFKEKILGELSKEQIMHELVGEDFSEIP